MQLIEIGGMFIHVLWLIKHQTYKGEDFIVLNRGVSMTLEELGLIALKNVYHLTKLDIDSNDLNYKYILINNFCHI